MQDVVVVCQKCKSGLQDVVVVSEIQVRGLRRRVRQKCCTCPSDRRRRRRQKTLLELVQVVASFLSAKREALVAYSGAPRTGDRCEEAPTGVVATSGGGGPEEEPTERDAGWPA